MGRNRSENPEGLPPCVYRRGASLYYVGKHADGATRWTKLESTWPASRAAYERIVTASRDSRWIDRNLYSNHAGAIPKRELKLLLRNAWKNSAPRGLEFAITMPDLEAMARRSGGKCELSGLLFSYGVADEAAAQPGRRRRLWAASLDRIDSRAGYTPSNCRLVCMAVNVARQEFGDAVLFKIADALSNIQQKPVKTAMPVRGDAGQTEAARITTILDTES